MPNNPPGCGCTSGSAAATLVALLDADHDCEISVTELENNPIVQNLFATDVMLEGQKAMSVGVEITAVSATFTP